MTFFSFMKYTQQPVLVIKSLIVPTLLKTVNLLAIFLFVWVRPISAQNIRYVSTTGTNTDPNTAISWATSTTDLQGAISSLSGTDDQVWVAAGTYKPTTGTDRTISFIMRNGVAIYGGFPADGSGTMSNRNPALQPTILSGDIGALNDYSDNTYHVIYTSSLNNSAVLDGFTITKGNASGQSVSSSSGGGIYNLNSSPRLVNCIIKDNRAGAGGGGGGVYNYNSNPQFINCLLVANLSQGLGGAIYNATQARPTFLNCTIVNNSAQELVNSGGAIYNFNSSFPTLMNCIEWDNGGEDAIANDVSGITYASNCLLEPGVTNLFPLGPILKINPIFVNAAGNDFRLQPSSPAINAGNSLSYTTANGPTTDLAGSLRIQNGSIDIGAFETGLYADLTPVLYARPGIANNSLTLVVDVFNITQTPTNGNIIVRITKDPKVNLSFDNSLTRVGDKPVQNSNWTLNSTNPNYYVLSTSQSITGGDLRSIGLTGMLAPASTAGTLSMSATVEGGGETNLENNTDADKIEYFQQ
ncbi:choice-of-anchor Q domain-containing protein [Spirosoma koreense]